MAIDTRKRGIEQFLRGIFHGVVVQQAQEFTKCTISASIIAGGLCVHPLFKQAIDRRLRRAVEFAYMHVLLLRRVALCRSVVVHRQVSAAVSS